MSLADVFLQGRWRRDQIQVEHADELWRPPEGLRADIDRLWIAACTAKGRDLYDGPMARVEFIRATDDAFHLRLTRTSYKFFFAFHLTSGLRTHISDPADLPNPLGVSVILESADAQLLLGRRSAAVAYYPHRIHPFAGSMEPTDATPFETALRELQEEARVLPSAVHDLTLLGLVKDPTLLQPEAVFHARTTLTADQIRATLDPHEHDGVVAIPLHDLDTDDVLDESTAKDLTPVCLAALALADL